MGPIFPNGQKTHWIGERDLFLLVNAGTALLDLEPELTRLCGPMDAAMRRDLQAAVERTRDLLDWDVRSAASSSSPGKPS